LRASRRGSTRWIELEARVADLRFSITGAAPVPFAASPLLGLDVCLTSDQPIESVLLRTSVRIEAGARSTTPLEDTRLREIFGDKSQWSRGSRSLLWAQIASVVSAFEKSASVCVALPCSFDLAAVASKYIRALDGGEVLLRAQFAGTVFVRGEMGLRALPIPLDREAEHALAVDVLHATFVPCFQGSAVLSLRSDLFEQLDALRVARGDASFEPTIEALLARAGRGERGAA
jgi:hypothetical protein